MVSAPIKSAKEGYYYVNLVLVTGSPVYLLLPYIYQINEKNTLKHWILVNSNLQETKFDIPSFTPVAKKKQ
jgi:hypothetical protein